MTNFEQRFVLVSSLKSITVNPHTTASILSYLLSCNPVQNSSVRLLRKKNGNDSLSVNEYFRKCHWLMVKERIILKMRFIVHKCLHGAAPVSLKDLLRYSTSSRTMKLNQHPQRFIMAIVVSQELHQSYGIYCPSTSEWNKKLMCLNIFWRHIYLMNSNILYGEVDET